MESGADGANERLRGAVGRLSRASVLVVGDAMLDRYVYGGVDRVSQEAPVPVLGINRELTLPGGAGNVVRHLGALGAAVAFVSIVGDDQAGSELTGLIGGQPRVEPWLLVQGGRITTQKTRFVAHGQQLLRADREDAEPVQPKLLERLVRIAGDSVVATSVTVLSDYRQGVLSGEAPSLLIAAARKTGRRVVVGARGPDVARYAGADLLAIGWRGLSRAMDIPAETDASVERVARGLRRDHQLGAVLIMRTDYGLTLVGGFDGAENVLHLRNHATEVMDAGGVGDMMIALVSATLAGGADLETAAELANVAASFSISRVGTGLVRPRDLLAALAPEAGLRKIVDLESAAERAERWRRAGWRVGFAYGPFSGASPAEATRLEQARAACDRLVVGITPEGLAADGVALSQSARAAEVAGSPFVDIVVVAEESAADLLRALRPELLVEIGPPPARAANGADLVRSWGGRVLADRVPG